MCVQDADDRCVLQFTLHNAAGCALHRRASRVIHRSELYIACSGATLVLHTTRAGRQAASNAAQALARSWLQSVCGKLLGNAVVAKRRRPDLRRPARP